jgi:hypothetical protein
LIFSKIACLIYKKPSFTLPAGCLTDTKNSTKDFRGFHQMSKAKTTPKGKAPVVQPDNSKRKFVILGLGGVGALAVGAAGYNAGWFGDGSTSAPTASPTPSLATGKPLPPVTLEANYQKRRSCCRRNSSAILRAN